MFRSNSNRNTITAITDPQLMSDIECKQQSDRNYFNNIHMNGIEAQQRKTDPKTINTINSRRASSSFVCGRPPLLLLGTDLCCLTSNWTPPPQTRSLAAAQSRIGRGRPWGQSSAFSNTSAYHNQQKKTSQKAKRWF